MKPSKTNFSIVIITFNEEKIIEKCIAAAIKVSSDVIIVDSFSNDNTKAICTKFSEINFVEQKWLGYSAQKNFGNEQSKNDWILSLDADEILSKETITFLNKISLEDNNLVYKINRLNNYCGKWIKHGRWYPEWRNRLFNKKLVQWNGDLVHEDLEAKKGTLKKDFIFKKIEGDVFHYSMQSKHEHIEKAKQYAKLSAAKLFAKNKPASLVKRFLSPVSRFLVDYFIKLGFLDGTLGFQIAKISAYETYLKYKLLQDKY
ncbi:MAG: glycosyltransferase family 2 protein [Chitinophagales bacterium]